MGERTERNSASFEEFFNAEFGRLQAVAFALTGRRVLAEELAQEAMIVVYKRWETLAKYEDPAGFARRVVSNKAISAFRRVAAEARAIARVRGRPQAESVEMVPADSELWAAVRALPRHQSVAVTLRYVGDLQTSDIAKALGCAEATVRVLLHRGRNQLAAMLGREIQEEK